MNGSTLSPKQQAFLEKYIENGGNASAAFRHAYPKSANNPRVSGMASRLVKHPLIQQALSRAGSASHAVIERVVAKHELTIERLLEEMACLALTRMPQVADVRTEVDPDGKRRQRIQVRDFADVPDDALAAIVEVKRTAGGEVSVKLADKRAALMDIARLKGWIAEKPVDNKQLVMLKIER